MQAIYFEENQKKVWNEFIAENCSEGFLQSWEWGEFQKSLGRDVWRAGVVGNDLPGKNKVNEFQIPNSKFQINSKFNPELSGQNSKLIAAALVVKSDLPFGRNYLYCPRGPVIKIPNTKYQIPNIFNFLFNEIREIARKEKTMFLRIDPPIKLNNKLAVEYFFNNFRKSPSEIQPRDTLMLDLIKSEEELLKEMKQKTRYNIKLAERKELRIKNYELRRDNKKIFREKFEEFWKLMKETSQRDKFSSHNKNYYWKILENLDEQARLYLAEHKNKIIAANFVLYFGDLAVYLHGASSNEHRNLMASYLMQWRQILDAKKAGYKKYDFWGVTPKFQISNNKSQINSKFSGWEGITRFKKGFGGEEKNYLGAYDLVFDDIGYAIYKFVKFIKLKV